MTDTIPELDPFQLRALGYIDATQGRIVLADPMGARKTGTTLAWLWMREVPRTLVVAPTSVHEHWAEQAELYCPSATVHIGMGDKHHRNCTLASSAGDGQHIYVTTYESMKQDEYLIKGAKFDAVVFDEGHRLKGRRTDVALTANAVTKKAKHIICVTGTPVINHPAELWQYLHMIAPNVYRSYWKWAEEHFEVGILRLRVKTRFPVKVVGDYKPGHEEIVRNEIRLWFVQRELHEMFPGQPWIEEPEHVHIPIALSDAERKLYKNLVKFQWGETPSGVITTTNKLGQHTRLHQLVSDWTTLDEKHEQGSKVKATVELVRDLLERGESVVVFAKFKPAVENIAAALGAVTYHGDQTVKTRNANKAKFVNGKYKVIVGTLDSLAESADGLQDVSATVVMHDHGWTHAQNEQAIGRVKRSGQTRRVTVYHVFATGTVDVHITDACLRKANVVNTLAGRPLVDVLYGRKAKL